MSMNPDAILFTLLSCMGHDPYPKTSRSVDILDYDSEYKSIKQKKSELSRKDRDRVIRKFEGK